MTEHLQGNDEGTLLAFIRRWSDAVASGDYQAACNMCGIPPGSKALNTPQHLRESIANYSLAYRRAKPSPERDKLIPKVSPLSQMSSVEERVEFWPEMDDRDERGITGLWYFLPLDGKWSQLRASFKVLPLNNSG